MRWLVCPDSFKDCLPAASVVAALVAGLRAGDQAATVIGLPLADGGEGTVAALVAATGGEVRQTTVTGPFGEPVVAGWGRLPDGTAVIEMASAAGLELVPPARRDPRLTTTRGVGELLLAALDAGCRRVVLGIGGSATNDAGAGMAQALGYRLLDTAGTDLPPGGSALAELDRIEATGADPRLGDLEVLVACDVDNPLCGPRGASVVYGPQKGASPAAVVQLDAALARWAALAERDLAADVSAAPGAGAAGGLGAGLLAYCGARLVSGADLVLDTVGFDHFAAQCDVVLTGEGRLDGSTAHGKVIAAVCRRAARLARPVIAVAGAVSADEEQIAALGLQAVWPLPDRPLTLDEALARGPELLWTAGYNLARLYGRSS